MELKTKAAIGLLVLLLGPLVAGAEEAVTVNPDEYYQSALQAYLNGDLDQAILMDSKALKMDPQNPKAQALLTVLIGEKDTAQKTVIWIGGKPSTQEVAAPVSQVPVTVIKERTVAAAPRLDSGKIQEMESRVQTLAFLLERDSLNQYKELSSAQAQNARRLDQMNLMLKGLGLTDGLLLLLAVVLAGLALWNSWRTRQELKRQSPRGKSDDSSRGDRVVHFRRG